MTEAYDGGSVPARPRPDSRSIVSPTVLYPGTASLITDPSALRATGSVRHDGSPELDAFLTSRLAVRDASVSVRDKSCGTDRVGAGSVVDGDGEDASNGVGRRVGRRGALFQGATI